MKNLPIGYSTLEKMKDNHCVYIDKTHHISKLVKAGAYYFLARPRRFGKSLLVDTLKQAFLGNHVLFKGLYLEKNWDWSVSYPVIHLDFAAGIKTSRQDLDHSIHQMLDMHFMQHGLQHEEPDVALRFENLIYQLHHQFQQKVVILIDEYDKPMLDNIENIGIAKAIRDGLKNCYSVIKKYDSMLKFVFLTGVSKFSKVNLFSGLNNLFDITFSEQYADICGYTQTELDKAFKSYLPGVDKQQLKYWYNGYNFAGEAHQKVYNPFDVLLFFNHQKKYQSYWIETGNPTFLLKLLQQNQYYLPDVEKIIASESLFGSFDLEQISIETLLFQTGYLTIQEKLLDPFDSSIQYKLIYPNHEVRTSLNEQLMNYFVTDKIKLMTTQQQLQTALINQDFLMFKNTLVQFFASIPYIWYTKNDLPHYEGFYASIVYSLLNAMGLDAIPEDTTNRGRIDLSVKVINYYLLFEFKVQEQGSAADAIKQIKQMKYPEKYAANGLPVYIMGMIFDEKERNVGDFAWESWSQSIV